VAPDRFWLNGHLGIIINLVLQVSSDAVPHSGNYPSPDGDNRLFDFCLASPLYVNYKKVLEKLCKFNLVIKYGTLFDIHYSIEQIK
jgi:hypothetical protein